MPLLEDGGPQQTLYDLLTSDPLPLARLHLLNVPQSPQTMPSSGDQVIKHRNEFVGVTSHSNCGSRTLQLF